MILPLPINPGPPKIPALGELNTACDAPTFPRAKSAPNTDRASPAKTELFAKTLMAWIPLFAWKVGAGLNVNEIAPFPTDANIPKAITRPKTPLTILMNFFSSKQQTMYALPYPLGQA
jgi:hypothetical protein